MSILAGLEVAQLGGGLAAAVCGRLFADVGARVRCVDPDTSTPLADPSQPWQDRRLRRSGGARSDRGGRSDRLRRPSARSSRPATRHGRAAPDQPRRRRSSPSRRSDKREPKADDPASDLTLFFASGIARMLTGQVDDLGEAPIRPVGEQSAFIGGIAAACAGMHAVMAGEPGAVVDVVDPGSAGDRGDNRAGARRAFRQNLVAQAADRRQRRHRVHPAGDATATPRSRRATIINGPPGSA